MPILLSNRQTIYLGGVEQTVPQLAKGGKLAYGWSCVGEAGRIVIPPDAMEEYRFDESQALILLPGSRKSGGFSLGTYESLKRSPLWNTAIPPSAHDGSPTSEGEVWDVEGKPHCWVRLRNGAICLSSPTLARYGISVGDMLLVIRGSRLALAFAVRGPIVNEAEKHPELIVYEP